VAETDLGSNSQAAELNGISLLQHLMQTSPTSQPHAISALAAFARAKSPAGSNDQNVTQVIQVAVNALKSRNPASDQGTVIDLSNANLTNADLIGIFLVNAQLVNTDFSDANLNDANLQNADLNYAFLGGASLDSTNFNNANLNSASFYQTSMCNGLRPTEPQRAYNCSVNG
jgi:uncharacterized protein YjbI with pentapeptide repeats